MNPASQFDLHPDAESLNGFIEHELPDAERVRVVDHLASCGRCREIVYLAQDAAGSHALPELKKAASGKDVYAGSWFSFWRLGWAAAGACAAVLAIAVIVQVRRGAQSEQVAKSAAVLPPLSGAVANSPQESAAPKEKAPAALAQKAGADSAALRSRTPQRIGSATALVPESASAGASQSGLRSVGALSNADVISEAKSLQPAQRSLGRNAIAAHGGPNAQQMNNQLQMQNNNNAQDAALISKQQVGEVPAPASAAPVADKPALPGAASQTVEVSAGAAPIETETSADAQAVTIAPAPVGNANYAMLTGVPKLPSGLPAVSTVAAGRTQLAVDAAGALYFSRNQGKKWQPVESQWLGRAVTVRLAQANAGAGGGNPTSGALGGKKKVIGFALFEIVNDKGAVWTSAEGKTWSPK